MEQITLTNMCMVFDGTRVLVQDRKNPNWPGITFPGGHVENGESFTDAVIREVFEETGLTVASPQLCGIKDWQNEDGSRYMVLLYKTDLFSGMLRSSEEGEVFWTTFDDMKQMPLADGMDNLLKVFLDDRLSEEFFYRENGKWVEVLK